MNNTIYMTFLMCVFVIGMLAGSLVVILVIKTKKDTDIDKTEGTKLNKSENVTNTENILTGRISETKSLNQILSEAANENFAQTLRNQLEEVDKDFEYLNK